MSDQRGFALRQLLWESEATREALRQAGPLDAWSLPGDHFIVHDVDGGWSIRERPSSYKIVADVTDEVERWLMEEDE